MDMEKSKHKDPTAKGKVFEQNRSTPMKPMQTVSRPTSSSNMPRSANTETHSPVSPGSASLPASGSEGSGSKTTAGDPSFTPISSRNTESSKGPKSVHAFLGKKK